MASKLASLLVLSVLAAACSASTTDAKDEVTDETSDELSVKNLRIVGSLDYGQTSARVTYAQPRYTAFKFAGNAGDDVDVWVRSTNGDPVTYILDNDFKVLAKNDDASATDTSSHVKLKLPANASATHYVIVRDYYRAPMSFKVELKGTTDFVSGCNVDADCVKVSKVCCDNLGQWTAVRANAEQAFEDSLACPAPLMCPMIMSKPDYAMAECNRGTHKCELVQPRDIACGGFVVAGTEHACPAGYQCKSSEPTGDLPGKCVQSCGGFAGFSCHDPNDECVDDPTDSCDPQSGGADCGGICQPKPAQPSDCRKSGCGAGKYCSNCWGSYQCIPNGAMC
jgi:hypothetical protein